jgi:hypothetical protein
MFWGYKVHVGHSKRNLCLHGTAAYLVKLFDSDTYIALPVRLVRTPSTIVDIMITPEGSTSLPVTFTRQPGLEQETANVWYDCDLHEKLGIRYVVPYDTFMWPMCTLGWGSFDHDRLYRSNLCLAGRDQTSRITESPRSVWSTSLVLFLGGIVSERLQFSMPKSSTRNCAMLSS